MAQKKEKLQIVTTPIGYASYPMLVRPRKYIKDVGFVDTEPGDKQGKYAIGIYVTQKQLEEPAGTAFLKTILEVGRAYTKDPTLTFKESKGFRFPIKSVSKLTDEKRAALPTILQTGDWFSISAKTGQFQPGVRPFPVLDRSGKTKLTEDEIAALRGGFMGRFRASVSPYTISLDGSNGVTLYLAGVQYIDEGVEFGKPVTFEEIEVPSQQMEENVGLFN